MTPRNDWKDEIRSGMRRENWSLTGANCIVKVMPLQLPAPSAADGYITLGKFLVGKSPSQIERALGLPLNHLVLGARICRFLRLPRTAEYEYELTARFPDGLAFNPAHSHPSYLPGSACIHQWRICKGSVIPVDTKSALEVLPGQGVPGSWLT